MARTGSVCRAAVAARAVAQKAALQELPDRAFLGLAVLAHLCISTLGAISLAARIDHSPHAGAALFEPSVLLFLLAGACTALLLLHMGGTLAEAHTGAPGRRVGGAVRGQHVRSAFAAAGIPMPQANGFALPLRQPAFSGLMDSVGHELRTPLNAIIGFSELMQQELQGPLGSPRYQEYLRHIRDSGFAVLKAAEDTMALTCLLADRESARSEAVDLDQMLDEVCTSAAADRPSVRIMRGAPCIAAVVAEPAALRQSLTNLVTAATLRVPDRRPVALTTHVLDDTVRLGVTIMAQSGEGDQSGAANSQSFAVARMLFELQGMALIERRCRDGAWRMTVDLPLAQVRQHHAGAVARALRRSAHLRPRVLR